jgi:type I restriction enzyme R subunit
MSTVGQRERVTQERVIRLFQDHLGYTYLGNWTDRDNSRKIESGMLVLRGTCTKCGGDVARVIENE